MLRMLIACLLVVLPCRFTEAQVSAQSRQMHLGEARVDGETLVIPLVISDVSEIVAIDMKVWFDSAVVDQITAEATDLLDGFLVANAEGDTLRIAYAGATAGTGAGAFAEILVKPADSRPPLSIFHVALNGGQIPVQYDLPTAALVQRSLGQLKRAVCGGMPSVGAAHGGAASPPMAR